MQQDFETTLNEFLAQAKVHFEAQNVALGEYENAFNRVQEQFLDYEAFVTAVVDSLGVIQTLQAKSDQAKAEKRKVAEAESISEALPVEIEPKKRVMALSPKLESIDPKKVLIVDQVELNRVLMGRFFSSLPVSLEFATSGEQALGKIGIHHFDLVLMNLQLNGMSGSDAIKTIRHSQVDAAKKTKIIAISGEESTEEQKRLVVESGADACIGKETPRDVLREKVIECLISASGPSA